MLANGRVESDDPREGLNTSAEDEIIELLLQNKWDTFNGSEDVELQNNDRVPMSMERRLLFRSIDNIRNYFLKGDSLGLKR
jgi:hypothetical protein